MTYVKRRLWYYTPKSERLETGEDELLGGPNRWSFWASRVWEEQPLTKAGRDRCYAIGYGSETDQPARPEDAY